MKRVLSIMGGGIRGIIPACCLVSLEKFTGKPACESFDFIGGTSTGALLTAATVAWVPAQTSLDVYLNHGREIFSPGNGFLRNANLITRGRQFDNKVLRNVVAATLGAAGTCPINGISKPMLITACDQMGQALYFTQDRGTNAKEFGSYNLLDAAVSSACATTYHDPWMVDGLGYCADGGCSSLADPVYQVCVEAFAGVGCYGSIYPDRARVISLGTGFYRPAQEPDPPGSLLARVAWVTSALVGSSKTIAAQTVDRHWPGILQVINAALPPDVDEADVDAIPMLLDVGQKLAASIDWAKVLG